MFFVQLSPREPFFLRRLLLKTVWDILGSNALGMKLRTVQFLWKLLGQVLPDKNVDTTTSRTGSRVEFFIGAAQGDDVDGITAQDSLKLNINSCAAAAIYIPHWSCPFSVNKVKASKILIACHQLLLGRRQIYKNSNLLHVKTSSKRLCCMLFKLAELIITVCTTRTGR